MKSFLSPVLGVALFAMSTSGAFAISIISNDVAVEKLSSSGTATYSGTFILGGYNPATQMVHDAQATFVFSDDELFDSNEYAQITVGLGNFGNVEVDGVPLLPWTYTFFSGDLTLNMLATLSSTGQLGYTITATSGDFWYKGGTLEANVVRRPSTNTTPPSVPDGGASAALLGMSLLAVAGLKKKLSR